MNGEVTASKRTRSALVVEGGAMRGIFSTGVLDAFLSNSFNPFDLYVGVSAGATNIASYLAEMFQRNYKVYTYYSTQPDFISWRKFLTGGHLVNLDWLWDITIKEIRLDLDRIFSSSKELYIGVTDAVTGKAVYLRPDKNNLEEMLKASSSIPMFYKNFIKIDGTAYVDGGLADPIPVVEAYNLNAKNIMVIRSRPKSYIMKRGSSNIFSKIYFRKYPKLLDAINNRPDVYQQSIEFMRNPPEGVKVFEINPPEDFKTQRLTKDSAILEYDYKIAYDIGLEIIEQWNKEVK